MTTERRRASLFKPILNIARFFVGDTIPRVSSASELQELAEDLRRRKVKVAAPAEQLLSMTLEQMLMVGNKSSKRGLKSALGLLAGLVLEVIEDDYFYVPDTVQGADQGLIRKLALTLNSQHNSRCQAVEKAIQKHRLRITSSRSLPKVRDRSPFMDSELDKVLTRLEVHLSQGERILEGQTDPERAQAHRQRLGQAYHRATSLIGRLVSIPPAKDHPRLRRRVLMREHQRIEIDALGAKSIDAAQQTEQATALLQETEVDRGETVDAANAAEVAQKLSSIADLDTSSDSDIGWFFDME